MTIVLTYTKKEGIKEQAEFEDDVIQIDLGKKGISTINLTPLASCTNLQKLWLDENQLLSIDLTSLASCSNLQELYLYTNQLKSIDLTPLASCIDLKALGLDENQLESIDLTPIFNCANLQTLYLSDNQLQNIDLYPLSSCQELQELRLFGNPVRTLDLTPLVGCNNLKELYLPWSDVEIIESCYSWLKLERGIIVYQRPTTPIPWYFLHRVSQKYRNDTRVQQDILSGLGLGSYGFIDTSFYHDFLAIPPEANLVTACQRIIPLLLENIVKAIGNGNATTGLMVEELFGQHQEIADRLPEIIELRDAEIQRVKIAVKDNAVDLRELWLTAYGYNILNALDIGLSTNLNTLEQIKSILAEMGFELKTGKDSESGVIMSEELKHTIWWIVENRNKTWVEISNRPQEDFDIDEERFPEYERPLESQERAETAPISEDKLITRFARYLNGPMGKTVLENLQEGEHFTLETSGHSLRVTKRRGKAEVTIVRPPAE